MKFKSIIAATCACLAVVTFNANAAFLPAPVGSTVSGSLDVVDPNGLHIGAVPVDFSPPAGDFGFMYLGNPGVGYNSTFYATEGTYDFIFDSDPYVPSVPVSMTVGVDQLGMRTFIDWNGNTFDILTVWDVTTLGNLTTLMAIDLEGDGIRGFLMPNGPFAGFNFIMDVTIATPIPAAIWLFGSGLIGLIGLARRKT